MRQSVNVLTGSQVVAIVQSAVIRGFGSWCVCWFDTAGLEQLQLLVTQSRRGFAHRHGVVDSRVVHTRAHRVLRKAPLEQLQRLGHLLVEILRGLI